LSWEDLRAIGGVELDAHAAGMRAAYASMMDPAPVRRAIPAPVTIIGRTDAEVFVQSYNESDPQRVEARVFHALRHCHGQTIEELRATALEEDGVELTDACVRRLADVRILLEIA
jgi:hypothetical protein